MPLCIGYRPRQTIRKNLVLAQHLWPTDQRKLMLKVIPFQALKSCLRIAGLSSSRTRSNLAAIVFSTLMLPFATVTRTPPKQSSGNGSLDKVNAVCFSTPDCARITSEYFDVALGGYSHLILNFSHLFYISSSSPPHPQKVLGYPLILFISLAEKDTTPPKYLGLFEYRPQTLAICTGIFGKRLYQLARSSDGNKSTSWKIKTSCFVSCFFAQSNPMFSNFPRLNFRPSSL